MIGIISIISNFIEQNFRIIASLSSGIYFTSIIVELFIFLYFLKEYKISKQKLILFFLFLIFGTFLISTHLYFSQFVGIHSFSQNLFQFFSKFVFFISLLLFSFFAFTKTYKNRSITIVFSTFAIVLIISYILSFFDKGEYLARMMNSIVWFTSPLFLIFVTLVNFEKKSIKSYLFLCAQLVLTFGVFYTFHTRYDQFNKSNDISIILIIFICYTSITALALLNLSLFQKPEKTSTSIENNNSDIRYKKFVNQVTENHIGSMHRISTSFAHEIKNPLAIISIALETIETSIEETNHPILGDIKKNLDVSKYSISRIVDIVNSFLDYFPPVSLKTNFDYEKILKKYLFIHKKHLIDKSIEIEIKETQEPSTMHLHESVVFLILMSISKYVFNCIESEENQDLLRKIVFETQTDGGFTILKISYKNKNYEDYTNLFEPLRQNESLILDKVGLHYAKFLAEINGGHLSFTKQDLISTFILSFPKYN